MASTSEDAKAALPSNQKNKKDAKAALKRKNGARKWRRNVLALSIAAIVGAVAASRLPPYLYSKVFPSHDASPVVSISSVQWPKGGHGLFVVKGTATDVSPGQLLYTFNQPVTDNVAGTVYPSSAPCAIQSDHSFNCEDGFAGSKNDTDQDFNISAAIVTVAQADGFGEEQVGIGSRPSSLAMLPHVAGPQAIDSKQVTRTN